MVLDLTESEMDLILEMLDDRIDTIDTMYDSDKQAWDDGLHPEEVHKLERERETCNAIQDKIIATRR